MAASDGTPLLGVFRMKTRVMVAAIGLPVLVAVLVFLPPIFLTVMLSAMLVIAVTEMYKTVSGAPNMRILIATAIAAAATPFAVFLNWELHLSLQY